MQIRRRPTGTKKVKTTKNIRKEGQEGARNFALKSVALTIRTQVKRSRNNSQSGSRRQIDISDDSDIEGENEDGDKFYDVDADKILLTVEM